MSIPCKKYALLFFCNILLPITNEFEKLLSKMRIKKQDNEETGTN